MTEGYILGVGVGALLSAAGFLQKRKMQLNANFDLEPWNWFKFGETIFWGAALGFAGTLIIAEPEAAGALAGVLILTKKYYADERIEKLLKVLHK